MPTGWSASTVDEFCSLDVGFAFKSRYFLDAGIPLLRGDNIEPGSLRWNGVRFWSESDIEPYRHLLVDPGDVILAMDRPVISSGLKIARATHADCPCLLVQRVARIRGFQGTSDWVYAALRTPSFLRHILVGGLTGTQLPHVSGKRIGAFRLAVPPASEQRRIVGALDSYLSRLDDVVATLERVQRNLKRYRASVLKAAVEGRLVPTDAELARKEGRDYEPADVLLQRILKERKARWIEDAAEEARARAEEKATKAGTPWSDEDDQAALERGRKATSKKYKEPEPPDTSELPELPEGWCWTTLEQLGLVSGGLTKNASKRQGLTLQVPYLRVANVYADELRLDEVKTIGVTKHEQARAALRRGDLLVVEGNGSIDQIGRVAVWDGSVETCTHQNHLIRVRLADEGWSRWCLQWLLSPRGREFVVQQASSTSGLHTLSLSKVNGLVVPICPTNERDRTSHEIDRLISLGAASTNFAKASVARAARLRQSILKWAFEGRLVDQDPSDEPASVLLQRIAAERAEAEAKSGKPKVPKKKKKTA